MRARIRYRSVVVKDLVGVVQDGIDDADLPASVLDIRAGVGAHQGRSEDDCQVGGVHAVRERVLLDAVQMKGQGAQGSVVRVREAVDNGVEGVAADYIIFVLCG